MCRSHGGAAPQVRARAQERIIAASDLAAKRLIEFMNDKRVPPPVRLAAARDLLDRAGLSARQAIDITLSPFEALTERILSEGVEVEADDYAVIDGEVVGRDAVAAEHVAEPSLHAPRQPRPKVPGDSTPSRQFDVHDIERR